MSTTPLPYVKPEAHDNNYMPPEPPPAVAESALPIHPEADPLRYQAPQNHQYTDGEYVERATGERFLLCVHTPDLQGNTHSLKNTLHFWQGTEVEFKEAFQPV